MSVADAPVEAVLVPVLNEESTIGPFLYELAPYARGRRVYLLDSGSRDNTVAEARAAAKRLSLNSAVIQCPTGLAVSIRAGMEASTEKCVAVIDGDGQHAPAVIDALFDALGCECDLVIGSRAVRGAVIEHGWPWHQRVATRMLWQGVRMTGRCR